MNTYIHITEIEWDTCVEGLDLPTEVLIEADTEFYRELIEDPDDCIGNCLSNKFGWCVDSFNYTVYDDYNREVEEIIDRIGEANVLR